MNLKPRGLGPLKPVSKLNPLKKFDGKGRSSSPSKKKKSKKKKNSNNTSNVSKVNATDNVTEVNEEEIPKVTLPPVIIDVDISSDDEYGSDAWDENESKRETKVEPSLTTITSTTMRSSNSNKNVSKKQTANAKTETTTTSNPSTILAKSTTSISSPVINNDNITSIESSNTFTSNIMSNTSNNTSTNSTSRRAPNEKLSSRLSTNIRRRLKALDQGGTVSLADACLGDYGCKAVADRLLSSTVTSLDLRGNQIRDDGAVSLARALSSNRTLRKYFLFFIVCVFSFWDFVSLLCDMN